jgi:hypothetical protein
VVVVKLIFSAIDVVNGNLGWAFTWVIFTTLKQCATLVTTRANPNPNFRPSPSLLGPPARAFAPRSAANACAQSAHK